MASPEDVIELGSSDEEAQPALKKRKVVPNAMVHIPTKFPPGVTVKPTRNKAKINPLTIAESTIGKGVTVTKVSRSNMISNPFAIKNNGKPIIRPTQFNPNCASQIINNSALKITHITNKIPIITNTAPISFSKVRNTIPLVNTSNILPRRITVKKVSQLSQSPMKRNGRLNPVNMLGKIQVRSSPALKSKANEVVSLDDDDTPPRAPGPQWYLRPEEQESKKPDNVPEQSKIANLDKTNKTKEKVESTKLEIVTTDLEKQNNKEPESNFIEITIEDSPAKIENKRMSHVTELVFAIDDSPGKGTADKRNASGSDEETTKTSKRKHSKKKLEYPKHDNVADPIEIEIELTPVVNKDIQNDDTKTGSQDDVVETEIFLVEESPVKGVQQMDTNTPKKDIPAKPQLKLNKAEPAIVQPTQSIQPKETGEFHPVYQKFIDLCFQLDNSEDMSKIVEKKIKAYYRQVPKSYTESEVFTDMVVSKISAMKAGPQRIYLYIKDVVDELNMQRRIAKSQPAKLNTVNEENEKVLYGEDSEFDSKHQRQIHKLEKTLKKLHRAIQKLEEQEVDFDDEEDSVYLLTERYKERMIRVHAKFCQLTNTKMPSEPRLQVDARPGQPKGPAKRLEKWINKKVPIGTPLPFPDFHDVVHCVREANEEDKLGWNEADIIEEARDLFTRCGKKLQRRRQENEWRLAASRIQQLVDPAELDEDLKKKLEENKRVTSKKETEVLNKFAERQKQLNLEVVEIGDQEAEESPVESEEEEPTEESTSLQTKEKRKERLKRLLYEKSKKVTEDKENKSNIENKSQSNVEKEETSNVEVKKAEDIESTGIQYTLGQKVKKTGKEYEESVGNDVKEITDRELKVSCESVQIGDKDNSKEVNDKDSSQMEFYNTEKDKNLSDETKYNNNTKSDSEKIHSLSDDTDKIDSDIDELHLLQKLHSDEINSSTLESSDSESLIAISDSLSSGEGTKKPGDIISIENSSYSESENKNDEQEVELHTLSQNKIITETVNVEMEIECSNAGVEKKINKSNYDDCNESAEDILLASSDEELNNVEKVAQDKGSKEISSNTMETNNEKPNKTADTTDTSSMDSVEITTTKDVEPSEVNADNTIEVTSITSTETGDDEIMSKLDEAISDISAEVTSITSSETVVEATTNNQNEDDTAEIASTKSLKYVEKVSMINPDLQTGDDLLEAACIKSVETTEPKVSEEDNAANAKAAATESVSSTLIDTISLVSANTIENEITVSAKDPPNVTYTAQSIFDTEKVASNGDESDIIPNSIKDAADVRESAEKELNELQAPEPMEVDDA